MHNKSQ